MLNLQFIEPKVEKELSPTEFELYWKYKNELWEISKEHGCSKTVVKTWYDDIILNSTIFLIRIFDPKKNPSQIGFMFIGVNDSCHEDVDYYIWDSYLLPDYRRQHIMETVFQTFVKGYGHEGKYCLFLLDDNIPAKNFWEKQFNALGYKECGITDYDNLETPWCHLHAYE